MIQSLNYNYSKKQSKPIRVAYVPKNAIPIGNNPIQNQKPVEKSIIYRSSIPKYNNNSIIKYAFNGSKEVSATVDQDIIKKQVVFEHKPPSNLFFSELPESMIYPIIKSKNTNDFLLDYVRRSPKTGIAELQAKLYELFNSKHISKIVNVYQPSYKENKKATGLGDFLRGNYYLMQFCAGLNIHCELNMTNHPLSLYLKNKTIDTNNEATYTTICQNIEPLTGNNFIPNIDENNTILSKPQNNFTIEFLLYLLTNCPLYENMNTNANTNMNMNTNTNTNTNTQYIYTIAYPIQEAIQDHHRMYTRHILEPTNEMRAYVQNTILGLKMREKEYITIHIRSGDRTLIGKSPIGEHFLSKIKNEMKNIMELDRTAHYLLLADSNALKSLLVRVFPEIKIVINEISHSGEGVVMTETAIKNTMLDLYLLSKSRAIFSLSCYAHGSGFSKWTAETYNIPYICKFVELEITNNEPYAVNNSSL